MSYFSSQQSVNRNNTSYLWDSKKLENLHTGWICCLSSFLLYSKIAWMALPALAACTAVGVKYRKS